MYFTPVVFKIGGDKVDYRNVSIFILHFFVIMPVYMLCHFSMYSIVCLITVKVHAVLIMPLTWH